MAQDDVIERAKSAAVSEAQAAVTLAGGARRLFLSKALLQ